MRPLKLVMTAFGPYREPETIDFRKLGDQRLFVISGNTGAGKTSIFDAICFALYGSASGEDRSDPRMLRSQFAAEDIHTSVSFEFAVGRKAYQVLRQMPHRKGGNKSETGGKAELYELADDQAIPAVDRFMVSDVNARIETIIGLTKEQFSQIVMLPQGEFRRLLTSDTDNKEEILRRIFRTELYERLAGRFQQRNRELNEQLRDVRATVAAYIAQAQETLPQREGSPLAAVFGQQFNSATQVIDGLELEMAHYEAQAALVEQRRLLLAAELDGAETRLREATAVNARYAELDRKREALAALEARAEEHKAMEHKLQLAERAAGLAPYVEQAERWSAAAGAKQAQLTARQAEQARAVQGHELATAAHLAEEGKEERRRQAEQECVRLQEMLPVVRTLAEQQQAVDKLIREESGCATELAAAENALQGLRATRQAGSAEIRQAEQETAVLSEQLEQMRSIEQQGKQLKRFAETAQELLRMADLEQEYERQFAQRKEEHDRMEHAWIEGQAALLAGHLHDGKPCPVCGSESHPAKAAAAGELPSRERLQQLKEQLAAAERELLGARAQAAAATALQAEGVKELAELGLQPVDPEEQRAQLLGRWKALKAETERLQAIARRLPELKRAADEQELALERQQASKERLQHQLQRLALERATAHTALAKELERVPEQMRDMDKLNQQLRQWQAEAQQLAAAWREAQAQLQRSAALLAEQRAYAEQAQQQLAEAEEERKQAEQRRQEALVKAGFSDLGSYKEAALTDAGREQLSRQLEVYRSSVSLLITQIAELGAELAGKERTELNGLQDKLAELKAELDQAVREEQANLGMAREAQRLATAMNRTAGQAKELEGRLEQVLDIYQMLKGDNTLKISFERYILIEFLEHILFAANARLRSLSGGQYTLRRSDRLETRGKQSGLGLDVYDAYTGQNRDVKTLSGGEKFNASLCLALGMTDVIQAHQGGISIEMMFIDEGFGSLDEESLQKAIATLVDLQKAGRMIGVISHVQELKEAFPACLEVTKLKEGYSRTVLSVK
jgi:exonuclease SbcC